ncbi:MAG: MFS transporter [Bacteroidales bacterium]|nr:MFS transporter [Bacteroidales bacterium]
MNNKFISARLIVMNFLEFAVWGAYLTSMGSFLAQAGLGPQIWLFFATQGFVSIFMPALMGIVADKWIPAQRVLSLCQGLAGLFMLGCGFYAMANGSFIQVQDTMHSGGLLTVYQAAASFQFPVFYLLYLLSVAFFMPTIAISNSVAYHALESAGMDTVKAFPPIRVFGTVGFIIAMLFVNFVKNGHGVQFQHSYEQFFVSGILGVVLCAYALTMPNCPCKPKGTGDQSLAESLGLSAFKLFKDKQFAIFFIFSMLLGASLQITNGYANTFITSFQHSADPAIAGSWGARNANALISLSQLSETLCILLIPFCMKKFGIKKVMLIAMFAWVFRFGFFGLGNPGMSGLWLFVLSCVVYGVAFDFFNISGSLYVNENTDKGIRSSAQGLFMLMTNGLGASIGTWAAGRVVNALVYNPQAAAKADAIAQGLDEAAVHVAEVSAGNWPLTWYIFAGYALVVGVLFMILFKDPEKVKKAA